MMEFLDKHAKTCYDTLFERQAPPARKKLEDELRCERCSTRNMEQMYRCTQCYHSPIVCKACAVATHSPMNPLHIIAEWVDRRGFWLKVTLGELGLIIDLGHNGTKCPLAFSNPHKVTIIHEHGIHDANIRYCECLGIGSEGCSKPMQLLRANFWPCSWDLPQCAITLPTMMEFQLLSVQGVMSAWDYYAYLRRLSDFVMAEDVPVSGSRQWNTGSCN